MPKAGDNRPAHQVSTPNNLPAELTSFVGREPQLAELRRLLRKSRLITLTGPGGAGKTRLALRLASGVLPRYPGGAWFIEAGPLHDWDSVERSIASALGVREANDLPLLDSLVSRFTASAALLVIDGAEHLVVACAPIVERLLRGAPALTVIATSREPLGVAGEVVWRTPPLTVPKGSGSTAERAPMSEAVRLFTDRAQLARPGFAIDRTGAAKVGEVCIRLDGLPLAIELAARLVDAMSVDEILARLNDRDKLVGRGRNAVPRYEPLRRAIDSSFDLLTATEKELFVRLAVFVGGFDAGAAETVGSMDGEDVLPTLMRLIDKSLVVAETHRTSRTRYRFLDTIREYALAKIPPVQQALAARRHAAFFLAFAQKAAAELRLGDQASWLERIEEETPNLRAAFAWHRAEAPEKLAPMAAPLARYWYVRGKLTEGLEWLDTAIGVTLADDKARLSLLQNRARLRRHRGDYEGARRDAEECVRVARRLGADLHLLGGLTTLGNLSSSLGRWADAEKFFNESLVCAERTKDPAMVASGLNNLALVESALGRHEQARERILQAVDAAERSGDRILRATIRETAGRIERRRGDRPAARSHYLKALELSSEFEDVLNIADVLDGLALLAVSERDPARALVLAASSTRLRSSMHSEPQHWDQQEVEAGVARARSALGRAAAGAAWRKGEGLGLREAMAYAVGGPASAGHRTDGGPALTTREMQVATLIAHGLTNGEIAGRLNVAERTSDAHVEHIRNKLGLHTRAQIAVWAHEQLAREPQAT